MPVRFGPCVACDYMWSPPASSTTTTLFTNICVGFMWDPLLEGCANCLFLCVCWCFRNLRPMLLVHLTQILLVRKYFLDKLKSWHLVNKPACTSKLFCGCQLTLLCWGMSGDFVSSWCCYWKNGHLGSHGAHHWQLGLEMSGLYEKLVWVLVCNSQNFTSLFVCLLACWLARLVFFCLVCLFASMAVV